MKQRRDISIVGIQLSREPRIRHVAKIENDKIETSKETYHVEPTSHHTSARPNGFLLDVVVRQIATVLELFAGES